MSKRQSLSTTTILLIKDYVHPDDRTLPTIINVLVTNFEKKARNCPGRHSRYQKGCDLESPDGLLAPLVYFWATKLDNLFFSQRELICLVPWISQF